MKNLIILAAFASLSLEAGLGASWVRADDTGQSTPPPSTAVSPPPILSYEVASNPVLTPYITPVPLTPGHATATTFVMMNLESTTDDDKTVSGFPTSLIPDHPVSALNVDLDKKFKGELRERADILKAERNRLEDLKQTNDEEIEQLQNQLKDIVAAKPHVHVLSEILDAKRQLRAQVEQLKKDSNEMDDRIGDLEDREVELGLLARDGGDQIRDSARLYHDLVKAVLVDCAKDAGGESAPVVTCHGSAAKKLMEAINRVSQHDRALKSTNLSDLAVSRLFRKRGIVRTKTGEPLMGYMGENDLLTSFGIRRFGCEEAKGSGEQPFCQISFIDTDQITDSKKVAAQMLARQDNPPEPYIWDQVSARLKADAVAPVAPAAPETPTVPAEAAAALGATAPAAAGTANAP